MIHRFFMRLPLLALLAVIQTAQAGPGARDATPIDCRQKFPYLFLLTETLSNQYWDGSPKESAEDVKAMMRNDNDSAIFRIRQTREKDFRSCLAQIWKSNQGDGRVQQLNRDKITSVYTIINGSKDVRAQAGLTWDNPNPAPNPNLRTEQVKSSRK